MNDKNKNLFKDAEEKKNDKNARKNNLYKVMAHIINNTIYKLQPSKHHNMTHHDFQKTITMPTAFQNCCQNYNTADRLLI